MKKLTRQKKELLKKIEQLEIWIAADEELGCGFAPPGAYDDLYKEIYQLQEELAQLMHYESAEEMFFDERGQTKDMSILRQKGPAQTRKPKLSQGSNVKHKNRTAHKKSKVMSR